MPKRENQDPETAIRLRREREEEGPDWRPRITAERFVAGGAAWLGIEIDELRSRRQDREIVRGRELLMVLGVERYRLKVKDLSAELRKSADGMTKTVIRVTRKRTSDAEFRNALNALDRAMARIEE